MATKNPFLKYAVATKTAFIEEFDSEIKYRELTMAENDAFNLRLLKNYSADNTNVDIEEATKIAYEKIALCLIEPKVTVEDLKALGSGVSVVINKINKVISGAELEVDSEGN